MGTLTRTQVRQRLGQELRCLILGTTSSASNDSTTLIDATRFLSTGISPHLLLNNYILITSGTEIGKVFRIRSYDPDNGFITFTPAASAAIATSVTYELWSLPVFGPMAHASEALAKWPIHDAIDDGLRRVSQLWLHYFTLVADGDMEGLATANWTAGGGATLSKSTVIVAYGARSLRVQNAAANEYARTANIGVYQNEPYTVAVWAYADVGTANLVVWDVTNSAQISSTKFSNILGFNQQDAWGTLWNTFTPPSGCREIQIRLQGDEATADVYWDRLVLLQDSARRTNLPSWFVSPKQKIRLVYHGASERYGQEVIRPYPWDVDVVDQQNALYPCQVIHEASRGFLYILESYRPYPAITDITGTFANNDAAVTACEEDLAIAAAGVELLDYLAQAIGQDVSRYKELRDAWAKTLGEEASLNVPRRSRPIGFSVPMRQYRSGAWY